MSSQFLKKWIKMFFEWKLFHLSPISLCKWFNWRIYLHFIEAVLKSFNFLNRVIRLLKNHRLTMQSRLKSRDYWYDYSVVNFLWIRAKYEGNCKFLWLNRNLSGECISTKSSDFFLKIGCFLISYKSYSFVAATKINKTRIYTMFYTPNRKQNDLDQMPTNIVIK